MPNTVNSATTPSPAATTGYHTTNCMDRRANQTSQTIESPSHTTINLSEVTPSNMVTSIDDGSDPYPDLTQISPSEIHQASDEEEEQLRPTFDATRCLFCHAKAPSFDDNVSHMLKSHNFRVPDQHRLLADLETLCDYLDLVISVYAECLYCGTERRNSHGARHHMLAKDHCRIDITSQDSEFREFYDWDSDSNNNTASVQVDETTLRLFTGKIVSDRSIRPKHSRGRPRSVAASTCPGPRIGPADTQAGARQARSSPKNSVAPLESSEKSDILHTAQLARLRAADRMSIAHLPISQQRAQLLIWKRQTDQVNRSQQSSRGCLEQKENKTSIKNFVADTHSKKGDHHHGKIWTP